MHSDHRFNEEIVYKCLFSWMPFHLVFLSVNINAPDVALNPLTGCLWLCYDENVFCKTVHLLPFKYTKLRKKRQ